MMDEVMNMNEQVILKNHCLAEFLANQIDGFMKFRVDLGALFHQSAGVKNRGMSLAKGGGDIRKGGGSHLAAEVHRHLTGTATER